MNRTIVHDGRIMIYNLKADANAVFDELKKLDPDLKTKIEKMHADDF